jgi:hypothetical protein
VAFFYSYGQYYASLPMEYYIHCRREEGHTVPTLTHLFQNLSASAVSSVVYESRDKPRMGAICVGFATVDHTGTSTTIQRCSFFATQDSEGPTKFYSSIEVGFLLVLLYLSLSVVNGFFL